jgi:hypothetical protein
MDFPHTATGLRQTDLKGMEAFKSEGSAPVFVDLSPHSETLHLGCMLNRITDHQLRIKGTS